jgi:hypothetical protein
MRHKLSLGRPCLETNAVGQPDLLGEKGKRSRRFVLPPCSFRSAFSVLHSPPIQPGPSLMLAVFPAGAPSPLPCNPNLPTALKGGEGASKNDASVEAAVFAFALQKQPRHKSPFAASKHTPRRVFAVPLWLNRINWPIGPWNWVLTDAVRALLALLLSREL